MPLLPKVFGVHRDVFEHQSCSILQMFESGDSEACTEDVKVTAEGPGAFSFLFPAYANPLTAAS